ncbi:hypothetical protein RRG08_038572 [Elysia crispata]|uniref:Uncharacterized protein n=1 Tax=Elysia crispata TaxID=231223 RepID=A0AAE1CYP7_9GAST|nr:hypothetical protein RRG08_038572 [Elysia crispata]
MRGSSPGHYKPMSAINAARRRTSPSSWAPRRRESHTVPVRISHCTTLIGGTQGWIQRPEQGDLDFDFKEIEGP